MKEKEKNSVTSSTKFSDVKFARTLKEVMAEKKLNQLQLAEILNIRQSQISNWLNGKTLPNYNSLQLFKAKLDILIENFFD